MSGGKCPGGICPWGKCPGGTCPGGLCPRTVKCTPSPKVSEVIGFMCLIAYIITESFEHNNACGYYNLIKSPRAGRQSW